MIEDFFGKGTSSTFAFVVDVVELKFETVLIYYAILKGDINSCE